MNKWVKIFIIIALILWVRMYFSADFPIPRGRCINADKSKYYFKNIKGVYYISVEHSLNLIEFGYWGYLKDVDYNSLVILDSDLAKDKNTVWSGCDVLQGADVASFHIDKSGLAKDRFHVYVYNHDSYKHKMHPTGCGIDVETAEYFVFKHNNQDWTWLRDNKHVYLDEQMVDVDRDSFKPLGDSNWWIDKDWVYFKCWDSVIDRNVLSKVDSVHAPLEPLDTLDTLIPGGYYLRNGSNIIYLGKVILRNVELKRFEQVGHDKCIINDMLFDCGEQILKDSLNVNEARFYFYGHIAADKQHVFYGHELLKDVDAATFHEIGNEVFEDKNYIYTINDDAINQVIQTSYPFNKKKKKKGKLGRFF